MARYPGLSFLALAVLMPLGSISVSSPVQVVLVDESWLGLDSAAGVCVSVACSILALGAIAFLLYVLLCADDGEDDDGRGGGDEPPAPEGPSGEPTWWPQFEQEFAAYVHEPARDRGASETPVTVASSSTR